MYLRLIALCTILLAGILALSAWDADAARFGGGKSFGGSPSMGKSVAPPPASPGMSRQQQAPGAAAAPGAKAPGLMGGMGGMLGGLLAGTLIGSLLFGGGFQGGGLMDILLIGLVAYLAFKLLGRFRRPAPAGGPSYQPYQRDENTQTEPLRRSGADWDQYRSGPQGAAAAAAVDNVDIPADFDVEEFLRGAKMAYTRLQASWDKRDMDDIAQFTTEAVVQEIRAQAAADPQPSTTEILLINARLLSVDELQGKQRATVYFDVMLREDPASSASAQVREVWHFVRSAGESWKLDGLQQVEG